MSRFLHIALFAALLACAACRDPLSGNGEGYTGSSPVPLSLPQRDPAATLYYWQEPGYTCQLGTGVRILSYRGAVQVSADHYVQYGDFCQTDLVASGPLTDLLIETDLLGLGKNSYEREVR